MLQPDSPFGQGLQPFSLSLVNYTYQLIALLGRVVEENYMISARDSDGGILEAPLIPSPDV
jgi:hypothetical protein